MDTREREIEYLVDSGRAHLDWQRLTHLSLDQHGEE